MSRSSHRFTLEDASKLPARNQAEIAAQLYGAKYLRSDDPVGEAMKDAEKANAQLNRDALDEIILESVKASLPIETESFSQIALVEWWHFEALKRGIPEEMLIGLPLQGKRTAHNAAQMKREGQRKGTPDLFLALKRGDRSGLWIEMKTLRKGSKLTPEQKRMLKILAEDYATVVCRTTSEAQAVIVAYLGM